eukprot:scaffold49404_cov56-Attheya_sp.AAC.4
MLDLQFGEQKHQVTQTAVSEEGIWIERGTILMLGVTLGRGTAATMVTISTESLLCMRNHTTNGL